MTPPRHRPKCILVNLQKPAKHGTHCVECSQITQLGRDRRTLRKKKLHLRRVFFDSYQKRALFKSPITPGIRHLLGFYDSGERCILIPLRV